ncbi:MAG: type II toxin-antitoxin system prevent-host-death family antitoxin [Chloroflexi bacterium]|nr:type II toxin-antitoxin system prevent-host-death family antitoxin [Chloroflexota bacterium]
MERQPKRRFVVTEKGRKVGVLLSMKEYRELMEDLEDLAAIAEINLKKDEPTIPFREYLAEREKRVSQK